MKTHVCNVTLHNGTVYSFAKDSEDETPGAPWRFPLESLTHSNPSFVKFVDGSGVRVIPTVSIAMVNAYIR